MALHSVEESFIDICLRLLTVIKAVSVQIREDPRFKLIDVGIKRCIDVVNVAKLGEKNRSGRIPLTKWGQVVLKNRLPARLESRNVGYRTRR